MNPTDKQAVEQAKQRQQEMSGKGFSQKNGTSSNSTTDNSTSKQGTRVKESANEVSGSLQQLIDTSSTQLANNIEKAIALNTKAKVIHSLESGNFLRHFDELFDDINTGLNSSIEAECVLLEVIQQSPKALPPSDSNGSSSSN